MRGWRGWCFIPCIEREVAVFFSLRCFNTVVSSWVLAGTGPGGPPTFLLRQKSRQKRRPPAAALRVPEKRDTMAGSEITRPAREGELFRFPLCPSIFREPRRGSSPRSPSLAYFSWRDKKSERLPDRPRQSPHGAATALLHRRKNHRKKQPKRVESQGGFARNKAVTINPYTAFRQSLPGRVSTRCRDTTFPDASSIQIERYADSRHRQQV